MGFNCPECDFAASKKSELLQHQRSANHWRRFRCDVCGSRFTRKTNLDRHQEKHRTQNNVHCSECGRAFTRPDNLQRHMLEKHQIGGGAKRGVDTVETGPVKRLRQDDDPRQFYTLKKIKEQKMEKFRTTASTYQVQFRDIDVDDVTDILNTLKRMFAVILEDVTSHAKTGDLIRMTVQSPTLDYPIVVPFLRLHEVTVDRFLSEVERVLQSNDDFVIDEGLELDITHVDMPNGSGLKKRTFANMDRFLKEKQCIIRIQNTDELCCARAIVTAKARLDNHDKWNSIRQGCGIQGRLAEELHKQASVPQGPCGIDEIKMFQAVLDNYQLYVLSKDHFNGVIYDGPEADKKIYLYYHDQHYDVITSMPAFLGRNYFCTACQKGYDHKEKHKCNNVCHACYKLHEPSVEDWIHCVGCNRYFKGHDCYDLHKKQTTKGNSTCKTYYRCDQCSKTINRNMCGGKHICGGKYCDTCKDFVEEGHLCYMKPEQCDELKEDSKQTYIFFDFECTQDDIVKCDNGFEHGENGKCVHCKKTSCGSYEHMPNLCVAHKVCSECLNENVTCMSECKLCGQNEFVFSGADTVDDFCDWLFSEDNYEAIVLCHNFQGYDSYPILRYLYKNGILPRVIPNGAKVMSLFEPNSKVRMIDSLNFLPMALSKLPKMFGFSELAKGYFPHLFNKREHQTVVLDHLPDLTYYNPDAMKADDRARFLQWYDDNKNNTFDFQHELLKYCKSDVDILRRCALGFRQDFLHITNIDPFEKSITIASACQRVFRSNFLDQDTIGLIPSHGYNPEQVQSLKALQWLKYLSHTMGVRIQHARNGGEKVSGPYKLDGYYETDGQKVALEFHGDFWHGNPNMYASSTLHPVSKLTMGELYQKTLDKKKYLEDHGYIYQSIWESEFEQQINNNKNMATFVHNLEHVTPLQPRDAFFGGRTEAFTLYKEASQDEKLNYYDVTSLYPFINKTGKIPLGHPTIITEDFNSLDTYEGLVKCKVLPPKGLFVPVLPYKMNGKLLFALCKTCATTRQQESCTHTDIKRCFIGTWVTDELKKAVEKGYRVLTVYEVWHFDQISQYDVETKSGGLFTQYVNTFLKIKQEASGWPDWCNTENDKQTYIQLYHEKEGILLDYNKIKTNKGMRALAKLMLNSFWGKFGQRPNMAQIDYIDDPSVYFDKLTSDREEVTGVNFVSEDTVELRWKYKEDFIETSEKTNVVIAAYTTAQARLKLHSYLEKLGPRALYADTDSVIFSSKPGEWEPTLGDYLGDLTDEAPGNSITTFVTGGPKNYAYQLAHPDKDDNITHCKVRGITLNYKNCLDINFDTLKRMVTKDKDDIVTVAGQFKICRDRDTARLLTVTQNKKHKLVFDKRVIKDGYVSYPFGY